MATTTKVRIALTAARELEIEVTDAAAVLTAYRDALESGAALFDVEDARDHRYTITTTQVAFVVTEVGQTGGVIGF